MEKVDGASGAFLAETADATGAYGTKESIAADDAEASSCARRSPTCTSIGSLGDARYTAATASAPGVAADDDEAVRGRNEAGVATGSNDEELDEGCGMRDTDADAGRCCCCCCCVDEDEGVAEGGMAVP